MNHAPLLGMTLVLAVLLALMAGLHLVRGRSAVHPELVRKLMHIGMGLVTLSFPWLFDRPWPVAALAAASVALLALLRRPGLLRGALGGVLDGVDRDSLGEIYFPVAVAAVFHLSHGDRVLFCVPVLLLTLGDAVAALVGVRYGMTRYTTMEGGKSAEGSLACFLVTFLSVHVPLLLYTTVDRAACLYVGLIMALLVTILEAVAWGGLDNLFVPLGAYVLLRAFLAMGEAELGFRLLVAAALVAAALLWRRRTTLDDSAVLAAGLLGYVVWALGGWRWLVAPATVFATYTLLWPAGPNDRRGSHSVRDVLDTAATGLLWLFLANALHRPELFAAYTLSFAAHLAIMGLIRTRCARPEASVPGLIATCLLKSWLLVFAPYVLMARLTPFSIAAAVCGILGMAVAVGMAIYSEPAPLGLGRRARRWMHPAGIAVGSLAALAPLLVGGPWTAST